MTKQRTTAFDWALNSGQPRVLRHLVREYRVKKDLEKLFKLVNRGDYKAVKEVVKAGEPYKMNHGAVIEGELRELEEEAEEVEAELRAIRADLDVKEPQLAAFLAAEQRALEATKQCQEAAQGHSNHGDALITSMLEEYENSMLFLQSLDQSDLSEVTAWGI